MNISFTSLRLHAAICVILASLSFILPSCRSGRAVTQPQTSFEVKNDTWSNFYAPVTVEINRPLSLAVSGRASMENGKYIHLSMRFLGMEMAVVYIDADSVYFVDKYHHYLFAESLQKVLGSKYADMTIKDLQSFILGQKKIPDNNYVKVTPSGYISSPAGQVASRMALDIETSKIDIDGSWEWSQYEVKWNDASRSVSFTPPSNYTVITLDNLESFLKNMSF